jgi:predicted nucleotidyltransferase
MKHHATRLAEVCARLNHHGANYVLVGASALQLWGSTRATRDVDILIEPTVENAGRVLAALSEIGFGFAREWLAEEVAKKPVTIIGDSPRVDILTIAWSVRYAQARPAATLFEVEGVKIPTASIDHLIASKRTGRLQDAADIEALEEIKRLRAGR